MTPCNQTPKDKEECISRTEGDKRLRRKEQPPTWHISKAGSVRAKGLEQQAGLDPAAL